MGTPALASSVNRMRVFGSLSKMLARSPSTRTVTPALCFAMIACVISPSPSSHMPMSRRTLSARILFRISACAFSVAGNMSRSCAAAGNVPNVSRRRTTPASVMLDRAGPRVRNFVWFSIILNTSSICIASAGTLAVHRPPARPRPSARQRCCASEVPIRRARVVSCRGSSVCAHKREQTTSAQPRNFSCFHPGTARIECGCSSGRAGAGWRRTAGPSAGRLLRASDIWSGGDQCTRMRGFRKEGRNRWAR